MPDNAQRRRRCGVDTPTEVGDLDGVRLPSCSRHTGASVSSPKNRATMAPCPVGLDPYQVRADPPANEGRLRTAMDNRSTTHTENHENRRADGRLTPHRDHWL